MSARALPIVFLSILTVTMVCIFLVGCSWLVLYIFWDFVLSLKPVQRWIVHQDKNRKILPLDVAEKILAEEKEEASQKVYKKIDWSSLRVGIENDPIVNNLVSPSQQTPKPESIGFLDRFKKKKKPRILLLPPEPTEEIRWNEFDSIRKDYTERDSDNVSTVSLSTLTPKASVLTTKPENVRSHLEYVRRKSTLPLDEPTKQKQSKNKKKPIKPHYEIDWGQFNQTNLAFKRECVSKTNSPKPVAERKPEPTTQECKIDYVSLQTSLPVVVEDQYPNWLNDEINSVGAEIKKHSIPSNQPNQTKPPTELPSTIDSPKICPRARAKPSFTMNMFTETNVDNLDPSDLPEITETINDLDSEISTDSLEFQ